MFGNFCVWEEEKVLLSEASILQNGAGISKSVNYYKKGMYTFVTLGQMETNVY